jgi:hypothetical protein
MLQRRFPPLSGIKLRPQVRRSAKRSENALEAPRDFDASGKNGKEGFSCLSFATPNHV